MNMNSSIEALQEQQTKGSQDLDPVQNVAAELSRVDARLADLSQDLGGLWELRRDLYSLADDEGNALYSEGDELYDEPTYNTKLIGDALDTRRGGTIEYSNIAAMEKFDGSDRDEVYRQAVLGAAQKHGFVAEHPGKSANELDRYFGVTESTLQPIEGKVDAVIIPGAAGKSNVVRAYDALRNILSGAIDTDTIILAGCDRPVAAAEGAAAAQFGVSVGENEIGSMMHAIQDVARQMPGVEVASSFSFDEPGEESPTVYAEAPAKSWGAVLNIGGRQVSVTGLLAPYSEVRAERAGLATPRANTEETFIASIDHIPEGEGSVVIASHDTWSVNQAELADLVFGQATGKEVIGSTVFYDDRVLQAEDGTLDLRATEQVVDEMRKLIDTLTRRRVALAGLLESADV